jgi:hypothetical protein
VSDTVIRRAGLNRQFATLFRSRRQADLRQKIGKLPLRVETSQH